VDADYCKISLTANEKHLLEQLNSYATKELLVSLLIYKLQGKL
jgi:hypothetical protein